MKPTRKLWTVFCIPLLVACTADSMEAGNNAGAVDADLVGSGTGGTTTSTAPSGGGGGGGGAPACSGTALVADAAHDYSFSSTLSFPPVTVAAGSDLTIDWSGLTKDFVGHPLDPTRDIKKILVLMWKLPLASLEAKTNADTLLMKDLVTLPLEYPTDGAGTSAQLLRFSNSGAPTADVILSYLDPEVFPSDKYIYSVMASGSLELGEDIRMIQSFRVAKGAPETTIRLGSSSTVLAWEAHIQGAQVTGIPAGQAHITLDWSTMTTNALGQPFEPTSNITRVLVGHYAETVAELETRFLDIELIASELYRGTVETGTSIDLATLALNGDTSRRFSGIDDSGTWVVALQCGVCRNPAPWYLTVLKPCLPTP